MDIGAVIVIVIVLLVVIISSKKKQQSVPNRRPQYRKLLARLLGDKQKADRLIEYERQQAPNAPESELIRNAIDRVDGECCEGPSCAGNSGGDGSKHR